MDGEVNPRGELGVSVDGSVQEVGAVVEAKN